MPEAFDQGGLFKRPIKVSNNRNNPEIVWHQRSARIEEPASDSRGINDEAARHLQRSWPEGEQGKVLEVSFERRMRMMLLRSRATNAQVDPQSTSSAVWRVRSIRLF